ncbi:MAG TPA: periplasmic heavy metal sensor [Polyangiaceae bacterium]|nr:periplasmic heavy metal sensor [Polyangiaceae bacterium]
MFGFLIGTACLIGFAALARRGRRHHFYGFGHGHGGCHGGHRGMRGHLFRRVLERLDTTPGQEKVIREAISDLKDEAWGLRSELRGTKNEIAQAIRAPELDRALVDRVFAKQDEVIEKLRALLLSRAEQIHGTLDERQRKQLADMIESGPWGYAGC